ncbi:alpha-amylase family glycosyl hydrolase [Hanstruepera marina]|uniref:alpha-amylase family glycosyl hydrolase n=1 Tax=Hanstruepera marina TaxID=2873265 RepID=UPI001CA741AD|nr:alpha-amylase family glycosyl hydrolase [Hanstruepera marina]
MQHKLLFLFFFSSLMLFSQADQDDVIFSIDPSAFDEDEQITITVSGLDASVWGSTNGVDLYLWAWYKDSNGVESDSPTNGEWSDSNEFQMLTNNGDGTYTYTLTPTTFYNDTGITEIGMLVKTDNGELQSQDETYFVGRVNVFFNTPTSNTIVIESGGSVSISAFMRSGGNLEAGNYEVFLNDVSVATGQGFPTFGTTLNNVTESGTVRVVGTPFGFSDSGEASFEIVIANLITQELPANLVDGINYNESDPTKATLVIDAPNKDFVYVSGSFNNWNPYASYLMKKNTTGSKFWLEITGLNPGEIYTYQYWIYDADPVTNSPNEVKTADPYSTLVLSPYDDPWIPDSTYPNLPTYPAGQEREVTVLQTGQTDYDWQVTNFNKPKKEDLVIYEVLIRDFDSDRNYQDLIDKIDYFKNLNINAIELMPIMEFEGNESWGYNTSFHMALDKFYGTENKLKEFIDTCHQNGIAVILDVALNHAFGRNPMVRMWMDDPDADGWGDPSSENPYFNQVARHSYNVGSDFNHQSTYTQNYVERVIQHWIEDYKIDGFRWDLTKGFTQNCSGNDEGCTNSYQQDRVDILKQYADFSWSLDPDHYVIFEHLGQDNEEQQWANYRIDEGKGIMMWGIMTSEYNQLTMGYASNSNINRMGYDSRGFTAPRLVGYAESHDEERLMYKNLQYGNSSGGYDVTELNTALERMSALGAVTLTVPGPKMIWHFGELGMENSIFTCSDGSVNEPGGTDGDCKLDTKPQPQWINNWQDDSSRGQIYSDWARLNELKINEAVFEGDYSIDSGSLTPRIYIWDDALPSTGLKNVVILANFDVVTQNIVPNFPYTGDWYDLMDETGGSVINVTNTAATISIPAGGFKIFGNASTLSNVDFIVNEGLKIYPNPTNKSFRINQSISNLQIYNITGKLVKQYTGDYSKNKDFNIESLNSGIYIIKARNNSGGHLTTKLVKI